MSIREYCYLVPWAKHLGYDIFITVVKPINNCIEMVDQEVQDVEDGKHWP